MDRFALRTTSIGKGIQTIYPELSLERCYFQIIPIKEDKTLSSYRPRQRYQLLDPVIGTQEYQSIELNLLENLSKALNEIHGIKKSTRFWQIILGHWLRRASKYIIFRIALLLYAKENFPLESVLIYSENLWDNIPTDTRDFTDKISQERFTLFVDTLIVQRIFKDLKLITVDHKHESLYAHKPIGMTGPKNTRIKRVLQNIASKIFCTKHSPIISHLYTSKINRICLFFYLKAFPANLEIYDHSQIDININLREQLKSHLASSQDGNHREQLILSIIPYILPSLYLEGFADFYYHGVKSNNNTSPRFILTANAFDTNESFKIRTALYTEKHIPYFVLQHGNNYGSNKYVSPTVEEMTSDFFLTWGWTEKNNPKYVPLAIQKFTSNTFPSPNKSGRCLIVMTHRPHAFELWNVYGTFQKIVNSQQEFISNISTDICDNVDLRLHSASQYLNFGEKEIALKVLKKHQIQRSSVSYTNALAQSRLVIFTSDSTGMLECLSYNYPCIAIVENLKYVNSDFIPYYELLVKSNILFVDPIEAAKHVNNIYSDVDRWWFSTETQQARAMFSKVNSRYVHNWAKVAATLINQKIRSPIPKSAVL